MFRFHDRMGSDLKSIYKRYVKSNGYRKNMKDNRLRLYEYG